MTTRRIAVQSFPTRGGAHRPGVTSAPNSAVEEAIASAVAAALRQDRHERRERRRLRQVAQTARSRSPRPGAEEVVFPEDWPSPNEEVGAPPGNFAVPGPATPPGMRFLATSAKYGGVPTLSSSSSSGSSRSVPESELRALRRASRAAASDAAWQEEEEEPPVPPPRRTPRRPAGAARPPEPAPSQPAPRTRTEPAPSPSAHTEPAPPPPARTRAKFPRGHPFHTGPRLLHLPLEMRWEPVPGSWVGAPPTWELCRKLNRRDCTGAQVQCPRQRIHACSQCRGGHPASHCLVAEEDLPPPDPPQGPPQRR